MSLHTGVAENSPITLSYMTFPDKDSGPSSFQVTSPKPPTGTARLTYTFDTAYKNSATRISHAERTIEFTMLSRTRV